MSTFGTSTKDSSQAQTVIDDIKKKKAQFELTSGKSAKNTKKCCWFAVWNLFIAILFAENGRYQDENIVQAIYLFENI